MKRLLLLIFLSQPLLVYSFSDKKIVSIEQKIFKENTVSYVKSQIITSSGEYADFQNALAYYRLGNLLTNKQYTLQSIELFSTLLKADTNVYTLSYLSLGYTTLINFEKGMGSKSRKLKTSLELLNKAVELYPTHYMPRFYRGMMLLFMPGIMGGNKKQGHADMKIVLSQINTIPRNDDYKSMVYFMYGAYWGHKKKYETALSYLEQAREKAQDEKLINAINKKEAEWKKKLK